MIHLISRIAAVVSAAAVLAAVAASPAAAAYGRCSSGEFCLYFNANLTGGVYHFTGSDSNLLNDRFEGGHTGSIPVTVTVNDGKGGTAQAIPTPIASVGATSAGCPPSGGSAASSTSAPTAG